MQDDGNASTDANRLQEIFLQVVALPVHERQDWIATHFFACDDQLIQQVQSLLRYDSLGEDPLEHGLTTSLLSNNGLLTRIASGLQVRCTHCHNAVDISDDTRREQVTCGSCGNQFSLLYADGQNAESDDYSNRVLGDRFELQECVGTGGFARVYKALDRDLNRVVAIKIPLSGQLSEQAVERFLREARSAAQLRHPNIVTLHEVGRDGDTIYIVSDFINGSTLAESVRRQQRPARTSAELIAKIASALEHAHDNGIIHRDLKPSNIMLDKNGEPHLTDFGLAKQESVDVTMTIDGQVIGTPAYMSPEQARGEGRNVDRRADIYALGAVLFEMLTCERPFRGSTRMIMHQVLTDDAPSPRRFNATVPRDLETICLKCLEKQPDRRYPTAGDMIVDLQDYLADRPIKSRPLGYMGRFGRWAKRKPIVAALSLSLLVAMILGTATSTYFAISAKREASKLAASLREEQRLVGEKSSLLSEKLDLIEKLKRSNAEATSQADDKAAVVQFFQKHVLAAARPKGQDDGIGIDATIRDAVNEAELRVAETFRDQPLVEADLRRTLAKTYFALGEYEKSITQYQMAISFFQVGKGKNHVDTLTTKLELTSAVLAAGNSAEAVELSEQTYDTVKSEYGPEHLLTLSATNAFCKSLESVGRHHEAKVLLETVYHHLYDTWGERHPTTMSASSNLASIYRRTGRIHEAVQLNQQALVLAEEVHGTGHPSTLSYLHNLAASYSVAGRSNEAVELYARAIELKKKTLGKDHPSTMRSMTNLSSIYVEFGQTREAIAILTEAQHSVRQTLGLDHPQSFDVTRTLARALHLDGNTKESVRILEPMLERAERKYGSDHPETCRLSDDLATFYVHVGRVDEAFPLRNRFHRYLIRTERTNPESTALPAMLSRYGQNLMSEGHYDEAEPILRESKERRAESGDPIWSVYYATAVWGECLLGMKRFEEAEYAMLKSYQELVDGIDQRPDYTPIQYDRMMSLLVTLYQEWGKPEQAVKWELKLAEFNRAKAQATQLRERGRLAADTGNLKNALTFYDAAEELPWQREVHRRARIYARTLQWQRAQEAFKFAFVTHANWQELGLFYRTGDLKEYHSTRIEVLKDYRFVSYSWNYLDDLQMALLEPLDPENEIPVRFLASINENHTDDPRSLNLIGKSKYRLGEFAEWYEGLPSESPMRVGQQLLVAISNFQKDPTSPNKQELQTQIALHRDKAVATLYRNIWGSHWADYIDQVAWVREAQRVLAGADSVESTFVWPDTDVNLVEESQRLNELPRAAAKYIAEGELYKAIDAYEELAHFPGMKPDRQLVNLYARTSQWESALETSRKIPGKDWRVPLLLAQLGRKTEAEIAAVEVLTNSSIRDDPSYLYRHARVAGLVTASKESREEVVALINANSPPATTQTWRCAMVGLLAYRLGDFRKWYSELPTESPLRTNTELLLALTNFQQAASPENRRVLSNEIERSKKQAQLRLQSGDLGKAWPEYVCRVILNKEASEFLRRAADK